MSLFDLDQKRFEEARFAAEHREKEAGIGTLSEKILHATLKNYFTVEPEYRKEQPIGDFVADIASEKHIIEIQTGNFIRLKKKIPTFLELGYRVTVVFPVMRNKRLYWIDPETGERTGGRKSPKRKQPCAVLPELLYINDYIDAENFDLVLFLYDGEEHRLKDGWGSNGKRGSHRISNVPTEPVEVLCIGGSGDFGLLLPKRCPVRFDAKTFSSLSGLGGRKLWAALKALTEKGILEKEKEGKQYKYSVVAEKLNANFEKCGE